MCELFDRIIYGMPVPALSFLMAIKVLNEARTTREVLMKMKRSRVPKEILSLIDIALIEGMALALRQEWWDSLKRLLVSSLDQPPELEAKDLPTREGWLEIMARDLLWEISGSNQCCLAPRKIHPGEEHELVRHLREYFSTRSQKLKIVSRAPLSKTFVVNSDTTRQETEEAEEESFFIVCLPQYILHPGIPSTRRGEEVMDQYDGLEACGIDGLESPRGVWEGAHVADEWNGDSIDTIRHEFQNLMRDCDIALGNDQGSGLASRIDTQLGWWRVAEVVCDCEEDSNEVWSHLGG